jgi:hypothetical protein
MHTIEGQPHIGTRLTSRASAISKTPDCIFGIASIPKGSNREFCSAPHACRARYPPRAIPTRVRCNWLRLYHWRDNICRGGHSYACPKQRARHRSRQRVGDSNPNLHSERPDRHWTRAQAQASAAVAPGPHVRSSRLRERPASAARNARSPTRSVNVLRVVLVWGRRDAGACRRRTWTTDTL